MRVELVVAVLVLIWLLVEGTKVCGTGFGGFCDGCMSVGGLPRCGGCFGGRVEL